MKGIIPETIVVATRNPGKLAEIRAILGDSRITLRSLEDFNGAPEVIEDAPTLEGNAVKKARTIREFTGLPALADDTGLEVDALGGEPGVYSARFAGPAADAQANCRLLLDRLAGLTDRRARFRTVIALALENETVTFEGRCDGEITIQGRGSGGFGYDPLFLPHGSDQTFAEMLDAAKNRISHRKRALDAFREWIELKEAH